jgi:hypothetical protein
MAIQIGKYKRPGIFIEEIDRSIFSAAAAAESITNLVIGVSKKGPVNTPIRLTTVTDLEAVFGQLDRNLERKGSFFHRTISKMLETTPVFAMNLLVTDDTLDKIEYKSLSSSAVYKNDIKREGPYRRFFDTTGFWSRDTESFINLTKGDVGYADRALGLTNLSDRHISVFVVKTSVTGFDRTLLEWYGSVEKMPAYVSQLDYASDYMVDVIVVGGDWSNYRELAVDSRWAAYFNTNGLIKGQLRNFANDRNITLLAYYEGLSLIPYFRDLNGRNIFIETSINRDTDKTGLFCQFNAELVEQDYYTGLVDLIGNTLADTNATEIDFLSYKEKITESVELTQVPLDLPGNVTSLFGNIFGLDGDLYDSTIVSPSFGGYAIFTSGTPGTQTLSINSGSYSSGATAEIELDYSGRINNGVTFSATSNTTDGIYGTHTGVGFTTGDALATIFIDTTNKLKLQTIATSSLSTQIVSSSASTTFSYALGTATASFAFGVTGLINTITVTSEGSNIAPGATFAIPANTFGATSSASILTIGTSSVQAEVKRITITNGGSLGDYTAGTLTLDTASPINGTVNVTLTTAQQERYASIVDIVDAGSNYQIGETITINTIGAFGTNTNTIFTLRSANLVSVSDYSYYGQPNHAFDPNNGIPLTSGVIQNGNFRTGYFGEGSVFDITRNGGTTTGSSTYDITYDIGTNAFAIMNDVKVNVTSTLGYKSFSISVTAYPVTAIPATYRSVFYLDTTGNINIKNSLVKDINPTVSQDDIVLGYVKLTIVSGSFTNCVFTDISVDANGYKDFVFGEEIIDTNTPDNRTAPDFYIESLTPADGFDSSIKVTFIGTNTVSSLRNYAQLRKYKMFNWLIDKIDSTNKNKLTLLVDQNPTSMTKHSLVDATITDIEFSPIRNKSFVLNLMTSSTTDLENGWLTLYTEDNEFILGSNAVVTKDAPADSGIGLTGSVGKYSDFYLEFYNGKINTEDFFYDNRLYVDTNGDSTDLDPANDTISFTFIGGETATNDVYSEYSGYNYIILSENISLTSQEHIIVPSSELNTGVFTIVNNSVNPTGQTPAQLAIALNSNYNGWFAYEVAENVTYESLTDVNIIFAVDNKNYLSMYIDTDGNLQAAFVDETLTASSTVDVMANNTFYVQSGLSNLKQTIEIETPTGYVQVPNKVLVNGARYTELKVGDFLEADTDGIVLPLGQQYARKITRVLSKRQYALDTSLTEITCDAKILKTELVQGTGDFQTTRYVTIDQYATTYKTISLKGFRIREASLPDGTEARQNTILNSVAKGTPLFKALTNKEAFDFRYLVDAFGLGLTERSKQQLVDICGERLDAFGFINMPSIRSFKNSSSPSFVNSEGVLQAEFIAKGGDPESNPAFLYSFGEGTGVSAVGYFTPYVVVNDNGRPLNFPPASYVATTYVRKHISNVSSVTPWTIAAGVTNGRVTNIAGLEIDWDPTDIEFLNPAQINPIVLKKNRGFVIETENTALVLYRSALSYIHTREVLIELERELSSMLLDYQWKFNTPDVRAEIKLRADVICETYVSRNGLFNYFNKMDDENNTAEIIDNQIGVLDTYVEPIKGMGIIVNNITILRTGAIAAGGFLNA